jgi:hypothetical protein
MNSIDSIRCPQEGDKILTFYQGYYDTVFIIFHPFIKPKKGYEFDVENDYPDKTSVCMNFDKVLWLDILRECDFEDFDRLDIALRNWIGGLVAKHQNPMDVEKLKRVCKKFNIIEPNEGRFQDCLIDNMISSIKELGYDRIVFGDEWGDKQEAVLITELESKNNDYNELLDFEPNNVFTEDHKILYTVHWDSHFTLLCSDTFTIKGIVDKFQFEGFYAIEETEIYWSVKD